MQFRYLLIAMAFGFIAAACAGGEGAIGQGQGASSSSVVDSSADESMDEDSKSSEAEEVSTEDARVSATITALIDDEEHEWRALAFDEPDGVVNTAYWGTVTVGDEQRTQMTVVATEFTQEKEELSTLRITLAFEPGAPQAGFTMPSSSKNGKLEFKTVEGDLYKLMQGELTASVLEAVEGEPANMEGTFQGELVFLRDNLYVEPGNTLQIEEGRFTVEEALYLE